MHGPPSSSPASAPCRLDWQPSRWPRIWLILLTGLAVLALWRSALPAAWALPASLSVVVIGRRQWRREGRASSVCIVMALDGAVTLVDGRPVSGLRVQWFGPLVCLSWREANGRGDRRVVWPDNLAAGQRRELRLAASNANISPSRQGMAP